MLTRPKFIYLDLDRTLIDTETCTSVLLTECERLYGLSADSLRAQIPAYYHYIGQYRYYDFFGQIASYGLDPHQVEHDLLGSIDQDFLFPDAHDMLQYLTASNYHLSVLSFGKHDFQQFKYKLAPQLAHIPFTSVLYPKGGFIAQSHAAPSLLIDDAFVADLPDFCTQFVIDRQASDQISQQDAQHIRIRSLQNVETILARVGYNEPNQEG